MASYLEQSNRSMVRDRAGTKGVATMANKFSKLLKTPLKIIQGPDGQVARRAESAREKILRDAYLNGGLIG